MIDAIERLRSLSVGDVMNHAVVEISANQTMSEAAASFIEKGVAAAPVVDEQGRCVGILSSADFLKRDSSDPSASGGRLSMQEHQLVEVGDQRRHVMEIAQDMVSGYMTESVQSIDVDTSLLKAATIMNQQHIHRLPVIGKDSRVIGLVSTMDVVAALLNAIDEMDASFVKDVKDRNSSVP